MTLEAHAVGIIAAVGSSERGKVCSRGIFRNAVLANQALGSTNPLKLVTFLAQLRNLG
jgi:hypothetical protein